MATLSVIYFFARARVPAITYYAKNAACVQQKLRKNNLKSLLKSNSYSLI